MKTITTVEELGALPEGAVIAFEDIGTPNAAVLASTEDGPRWWTTVDAPSANGDGYPHESIWSFYGESGEPGITLVYPLVFDAAWEQPIRGLCEAAIKRANDPLAARGFYGEAFPATVYAQDILALLEGGAEDK